MSYAIHAYLMEGKKFDDTSLFNSVKNLFLSTKRVQFTITKNIFTQKDYLKLIIDNYYSISVFFDNGAAVSDDLEYVFGKRLNCSARMRFLFAPDPENDFDDIAVIILDYIQSLNQVIVYNTNQNKIIFSSL